MLPIPAHDVCEQPYAIHEEFPTFSENLIFFLEKRVGGKMRFSEKVGNSSQFTYGPFTYIMRGYGEHVFSSLECVPHSPKLDLDAFL